MPWKMMGNFRGPIGPQGNVGTSTVGQQGPVGKDGIGLAGAFLDAEYNLVLTMTDGSVEKVGCVRGATGKDGKDGIDFKDLNEFYEDDGRILVRQWLSPSGEIKKEFRHVTAAPLFRGIWKQENYLRGDQVTYNGSQWIALTDTGMKPGDPNSGWQLTVKRGRDGKQ